MTASEHFEKINEQLKSGVMPATETVRSLLLWFGVTRRGLKVIQRIRAELKEYGLQTTPDFENAYIDEPIQFVRAGESTMVDDHANDPTHRISRLEAAHHTPISVKPNDELTKAITMMLTHDFGQLPVMTTPRGVKGIISWQSIGSRLGLAVPGQHVKDFTDPVRVVDDDSSLNEAITIVSREGCVLVKAADKSISGIVTVADLTLEYQKLSLPFLLIGEIENFIRKLISGRYSKAELSRARLQEDVTRRVSSVSDLTFGEYVRLIENESKWEKLELNLDRVHFVNRLSKIREIRNEAMHFSPDGLTEEDLGTLQAFVEFLRKLHRVKAF